MDDRYAPTLGEDKSPLQRRRKPTREELLVELASLPDESFATSAYAAAFLDTSTAVLANWRQRRRGPPFMASGRKFVRYRVGDLRRYMAERMKATAD